MISRSLLQKPRVAWLAFVIAWLGACLWLEAAGKESRSWALGEGVSYTNYYIAEAPWSIHVVKMDRACARLGLRSVHAGDRTMGLSTLSMQMQKASRTIGRPVAAINGDFFNRDSRAGAARGLQISEGEVLSAPSGRAVFWLDPNNQPHMDYVDSRFRVVSPDGAVIECGLNEDPRSSPAVLYTPSMPWAIQSDGGLELTFEPMKRSPWLPLRMGQTYKARLRNLGSGADIPMLPGVMILSLNPSLLQGRPPVHLGEGWTVSTYSNPDLKGVRTAIGGGPILLKNGLPYGPEPAGRKSYTLPSFLDRNPRSAIGWNRHSFFLVEVDGRQSRLSAGMTLEEFADYLLQAGCTDAMNLDGGGSSTIWFQGKVMNSPSDGKEREIANALVIVEEQQEVVE